MEMWNNKWSFKYDKYTLQDTIEFLKGIGDIPF